MQSFCLLRIKEQYQEEFVMVKKKTQKLAVCAIFGAIIAVISFLPLRTAGLEITLSMVPIAVGAICFGPTVGLFLGTVFGTVSFLQCVIGFSPFGAALLSINPWLTFLVCVPTRMLAGYLCGVIHKAVCRLNAGASYVAASLAAPLLNTALFMGTLVAFFYNTELIQGFATSLNAANPFVFVLLFVGINGLVELIVGFVLAVPCSWAVDRALKSLQKQ